MFHGLTFYTEIDSQSILAFRKKYDPTYSVIPDHIGIIFPVPDKIPEAEISDHISKVLSGWQPFEIHINGYIKSWDHWLFLTLNEGNEAVIKLFNEMYTGILEPYFRADLPFIPHISIGYVGQGEFNVFDPKDTLNERKYFEAVDQLKNIEIDFWRKLDRLTLISLNDDLTEAINIKGYNLVERQD
jgi:2'-5' RNA ligase